MKKTYLCGIAAALFLLICSTTFFSCRNPSGGEKNSTLYEITISTSIVHGTVTKSPDVSTAGKTVTLTVTPASDYALKADFPVVTKDTDGNIVTVTQVSGQPNKWKFTMPSDDVTVYAEFESSTAASFAVVPVLTLTPLPLAIQYTWTDSSPLADSYDVYYVQGAGKTAAQIKAGTKVTGASKGDSVSGLTAGTTYSFLVTAVKDGYTDANSIYKTAIPGAASESISIYITQPAGGNVTAAPKTTDLAGGEHITLSITPPAGKMPVFVTVRGLVSHNQIRVDDCSSFTMPAESVSVSVQFGPEQAFPILIEGAPMMDLQIWNAAHQVEGFYTWQDPTEPGFLGGINGNPAWKITLDAAWSQVLYLNEYVPYALNSFDALSFWVRGDTAGKFGGVQFGEDDYAVSYKGEANDGIPFTTEWTRVIIPVPKSISQNVQNAFLFTAGNGLLYGKTLFIDRVELVNCDVSLDAITLVESKIPKIAKNPQTTPVKDLIENNMMLRYTVDGQTVTLIQGANVNLYSFFSSWTYNISGQAAESAGIITPEVGGTAYTMSISLGEVISNVANLGISRAAFLIIDPFLPGDTSAAMNDPGAVKNGDTWGGGWWAGYAGDAFLGGVNAVGLMGDNGGATWYARTWGGPWNLSSYDVITLDFAVKNGDTLGAVGGTGAQYTMRIDFYDGTAWRNGPNIAKPAAFQTWASREIQKSAYPVATNWTNITRWRMSSNASPGGAIFYLGNFKATTGGD